MLPLSPAPFAFVPTQQPITGRGPESLLPIASTKRHTVIYIFRHNIESTAKIVKNRYKSRGSGFLSPRGFLHDKLRRTVRSGWRPPSGCSWNPTVLCASSGGGSASVIDWFPRAHVPGARKKPLGTKQRGEPALKWRCRTEQREKFAITTMVSILAFQSRRKAGVTFRKL